MTPLHHTIGNTNKECLALLISHGAEVNMQDKVRKVICTSSNY